jgi:hydroxypyruvate isomerase
LSKKKRSFAGVEYTFPKETDPKKLKEIKKRAERMMRRGKRKVM